MSRQRRSDEIRLAQFTSESGRRQYLTAYEAALSLWPTEYQSVQIPTRFGSTHAVISGSERHEPLILVPAAIGVGAIQWHRNVGRLADAHRVVALDLLGAPGLGTQTAPILSSGDCADWLVDVIDGLGIDRARVVGTSQGGWFALNLAVEKPDRVRRVAAVGPAASLLPFRWPVLWTLRVGPHLPAFTARYTIQANFGRRYTPDDRFFDLAATALRHFRYQDHPIFPSVFTDAELQGLKAAVLVLIGDKELIFDPRRALDRADHLIPSVQTSLIPEAGHLPNMERPEEVVDALLGFFSESEQS